MKTSNYLQSNHFLRASEILGSNQTLKDEVVIFLESIKVTRR